ncbi:MAG: hypothetical protein MZU95_12920 [Desulfomicrobium escambiense]|nr:hypothetical protein [Desulfomicrobium escambiense]
MRIAVDAMGGFRPQGRRPGRSPRAAADFGVDVLLVGHRERHRRARVAQERHRVVPGFTIIDAPEEIGMGEGLLAFRKKKLLRSASGPSSSRTAGPTPSSAWATPAAVVYISRDVLGSLKGVDRPALAILVPGGEGQTPAPRCRRQRQLPAPQPRPVRPHGQDLHGGGRRGQGPARSA